MSYHKSTYMPHINMDQRLEELTGDNKSSKNNDSLEDLFSTAQISENEKSNHTNTDIKTEEESKMSAIKEEKPEEVEIEIVKKREEVTGIDVIDHPGGSQTQIPIQPRRVVKKGRSLIPRKPEEKVPQNFVDVPDYGYVGIDGSFQVPF